MKNADKPSILLESELTKILNIERKQYERHDHTPVLYSQLITRKMGRMPVLQISSDLDEACRCFKMVGEQFSNHFGIVTEAVFVTQSNVKLSDLNQRQVDFTTCSDPTGSAALSAFGRNIENSKLVVGYLVGERIDTPEGIWHPPCFYKPEKKLELQFMKLLGSFFKGCVAGTDTIKA
ncbi:MAG: hypothetical protein AAF702_28120 [Chloroflexota bacterium]